MKRQHRQQVTRFTCAQPAKRPARRTFNALPAVITIAIIAAALIALRLTLGA